MRPSPWQRKRRRYRDLVALDVGPLGELLEPMGTLSFERAYDLFREMAEAGAKAGADLIVVETMTDLYEPRLPCWRPRRPPTCRCLSP